MGVGAQPSEKVAVLIRKYLARFERQAAEVKAQGEAGQAPPEQAPAPQAAAPAPAGAPTSSESSAETPPAPPA
jgi:small subunit ribosomal protein S16